MKRLVKIISGIFRYFIINLKVYKWKITHISICMRIIENQKHNLSYTSHQEIPEVCIEFNIHLELWSKSLCIWMYWARHKRYEYVLHMVLSQKVKRTRKTVDWLKIILKTTKWRIIKYVGLCINIKKELN